MAAMQKISSISLDRAALLRPVGVSQTCMFKPATRSLRQVAHIPAPACPSAAVDSERRHIRCVAAQAKKGGGGGKGGKGDKDGGGGVGAAADLQQIEKEALKDAEERMKKCLGSVMDNFATIRTGRANPAILDRVMVDSFGSPVPLKSLASISVPEATTLLITPYDPSTIKAIEKAINESDVGINPNNDGEKVRLMLPQLTQDRRKELAKQASKLAEDGKVAVRNVRKEVLKKMEKVDLPKDNKKSLEDGVQKLTDAYNKKLDDAAKAKGEELMKL